jgi:hypothetical protein
MTVLPRRIKEVVYGVPSDDETERAAVLVFDSEGNGSRIYASGAQR